MRQMVSLTNRFLDQCEVVAIVIANGLLAIMLVIGLGNIVVREVLGKGIIWIFPWTMVFFVWLVFVGYFIVFRRRADVVLEIVVAQFGHVGRLASRAIGAFCAVALNAAIILQLPRILQLKRDKVEIAAIPDYAVTLPLFVSAGLVILSAIVLLFDREEQSDHSAVGSE